MSDFDKEAEREKLRKKFADDEEKRADTQRMSELLLKGATMTNKHCDRCGDPLFRYNGQTFCSTCQAEGAADADAGTAGDAQPTGDDGSEAPRMAESRGDQSTEPRGDRDAEARPEQSSQSRPQRVDAVRDETGAARSQRTSEPAPTVDGEPRRSAGGGETAAAGSLAEARQSLRRTVTRFARAAEETDEPRRARELLAAAREAAEALAALD
ncbi:Sjogren's syndrome/scleroderma autoantigen 1 family protein [Halohasta salina]|uniref:Sjogren's syndrome/scleroderma autoantigen 1 family protein n=1 Tax=Halohasta salina TaxID=2961621 RepID=UPI0020A56D1D|nr:Sjogren's syndrome/scleroderma autoantigen 1 family protein [Halohasta salina]